MKTVRVHAQAPAKPRQGAPCNGCGICCAGWPCPLSRLLLAHRRGPCPALHWQGQRYRCDLLARPRVYLAWLPARMEPLARRVIARWIALDEGCDCDAEVEL
ncbi:MAG: hypothetical protein N2441_10065 [Rhodocyclaceae bacterium]|nr:hypothetical protein [Rhodocyclaceae bacterium]